MMMNKFNWGHGITIFYIVFVGIVATALVASFSVDHSLVIDDYYAQDLAYQARYDKMKNSIAEDKIDIQIKGEKLEVVFLNAEHIGGTIHFYRASDKSKDFYHAIKSNKESISIKDLNKGKWKLKIDWNEGTKSFYKETELII